MTIRLNIIGAGKLGRTLAQLWHSHQVFDIGDITNQSMQSAVAAINFIGAGRATKNIESMHSADAYLISVPDDVIADCARELLTAGIVEAGNIIFHCSGALPSTVLVPEKSSLQTADLRFASVHPMRSFADPSNAVDNFTGTFCGIEGDANAVSVLSDVFEKIGGQMFSLDAENKTLYHAACCITSNYLTALMEFALRCFEKGGVEREQALRIMRPLAQGTMDNVFALGPTDALTGPIERGDVETVRQQLESVGQWSPKAAELYRLLSQATLELSRQKRSASETSLAQLATMLQTHPED